MRIFVWGLALAGFLLVYATGRPAMAASAIGHAQSEVAADHVEPHSPGMGDVMVRCALMTGCADKASHCPNLVLASQIRVSGEESVQIDTLGMPAEPLQKFISVFSFFRPPIG